MNKTINISEVMTALPHSVGIDQSLAVAKKMMQQYGIRHLPVQDGGKLVGVISDRDVWFALKSEQTAPDDLRVSDNFTPEPYCVSPTTKLSEVAQTMAEREIGCALITQQDQLVGIFTTVDACRVLAKTLNEN